MKLPHQVQSSARLALRTWIALATVAALSACAPRAAYVEAVAPAPPDAPPASEPPAAPVDERSPAQVVADLLVSIGYACEPDGARLKCSAPNAGWWVYVDSSLRDDGQTYIVYSSYLDRAFGRPCAKYATHVADLAVAADGFSAACNDETQQFQLMTTAPYAGFDVGVWMNSHVGHFNASRDLLRSSHALRTGE